MKQAVSNVRPNSDKIAQSNQPIRMLCALHTAAMPKNIAGSFKGAGLAVQLDMEHEHFMARINPTKQKRHSFMRVSRPRRKIR
jgi:hypothetical protein